VAASPATPATSQSEAEAAIAAGSAGVLARRRTVPAAAGRRLKQALEQLGELPRRGAAARRAAR